MHFSSESMTIKQVDSFVQFKLLQYWTSDKKESVSEPHRACVFTTLNYKIKLDGKERKKIYAEVRIKKSF